jgi:hypothetical protein
MDAAKAWQDVLRQLETVKKLSAHADKPKTPKKRNQAVLALQETCAASRSAASLASTASCSSDADCEKVVLELKVGSLWVMLKAAMSAEQCADSSADVWPENRQNVCSRASCLHCMM